jgi:chemotaxis protein MotB
MVLEMQRLNRALTGTQARLSVSETALAEKEGALGNAKQRITALEAHAGRAKSQMAQQNRLISQQQSRIEELDRLIKRRLVERVEELEQYSSDFFGRLRQVFADNPDIKVEGDRFVFQSEVLFPSGEAELSGTGEGDLDKFVEVYRQVEAQIPKDLPVIIEIQGHTDKIPIRTAQFASNWELSTHRALGVVKYLIEKGIPPNRLAAVGMGEYHPIVRGDDPSAFRKNRRIELKITSR